MKILVINGPNLNMLGIREPEIYGSESYTVLMKKLQDYCSEKGAECECYQSNHEGFIIDKIQQCYGNTQGIIINPAAYTHTSIAIADALKSVNIPTVEVHISDISKREDFRKVSYVSPVAIKTFMGFGTEGYFHAADYLMQYLSKGK